MHKPISKYDRILNKFRENDFTEKEVEDIRNFINNIVSTLPKLQKLTYDEYIELEEKDSKTFYQITTDDGSKTIDLYLGTERPYFLDGVFGASVYGNAIYQ